MSSEARKQETRETILDPAERLLTGYGKMAMGGLAEEADIGADTASRYFPGKAEALQAMVTRANLRLVEGQRRIAASPGTAKALLREVLTQCVMITSGTLADRNTHSGRSSGEEGALDMRAGWPYNRLINM